jgi:hypothetical protein
MSHEELKNALLAMPLKGDRVVFFDSRVIHPSHFESLADLYPDNKWEIVFFPVRVPSNRTLRGCVLLRNPFSSWFIGRWFRFTYWLDQKRGASEKYEADV